MDKPVPTDFFSPQYKEWVKQAKLPPLTNVEYEFAEWLLLPENAKVIAQIGSLEPIFKSVRKFIKK